jgi:hypothetical protein
LSDETQASSPSREPRAVSAGRALAWFAEAIRLWKRAPLPFSVMAVVVLAVSFAGEVFPILGIVASNVITPLLMCGLLYGNLAADRDSRPRIAHMFAVFGAPLRAQAAVVASALIVTAVESLMAWNLAGVNLLVLTEAPPSLSAPTVMAVFVAGIAASLPFTFVPMAVLFDGEAPLAAFASSLRAFGRNVRPLASLGIYNFALLTAGFVTWGFGLVLALPWIAAASYAAWKDVYDVPAVAATPSPAS